MPIDSRDITAVYSDTGHVVGYRQAAPSPPFFPVPFVLWQAQTPFVHSSTTADTIITGTQVTIPGAVMKPGTRLEYVIEVEMTNNANNKAFSFRHGTVSQSYLLNRSGVAVEHFVWTWHVLANGSDCTTRVDTMAGMQAGTRPTLTAGADLALELRVQLASAADSVTFYGRHLTVWARDA